MIVKDRVGTCWIRGTAAVFIYARSERAHVAAVAVAATMTHFCSPGSYSAFNMLVSVRTLMDS